MNKHQLNTLISSNTRIYADTSSLFHFGGNKTSTPTKTKDFKWHNMCSYYVHCQAGEDEWENYKKNFIPFFHVLCVTWHLILHIAYWINRNKIPAQQKKNNAGCCAWPVRPTAIGKKDLLVNKLWWRKVKKPTSGLFDIVVRYLMRQYSPHTFSPQRRIRQTIDPLFCQNFQNKEPNWQEVGFAQNKVRFVLNLYLTTPLYFIDYQSLTIYKYINTST